VIITKPTRDLRQRLLAPHILASMKDEEERKLLHQFVDLLDKCLNLTPEKRLTVKEALQHPFVVWTKSNKKEDGE
jgi:serine/threonine-protein kinase PRP4